jgi:flagellar hook protein FlgE
MQQSFYSSISGASTHQKGIETWANNIANVNTAGFRYDTVEFKSLISDSLRNNGQVSSGTIDKKVFGVTAAQVRTNFSQAPIVQTDNEFDLSINGAGFFIVGDKEGNLKYTRDGSFTKNRNGYLVNSSGYYLYGVDLNKVQDNILIPNKSNDELNTQKLTNLKRIKIPGGTIYKPTQTTNMDMAVNLNSRNNIKSLDKAYSGLLYNNNEELITSRPLAEFINIKNGDKLQINTNAKQGKSYIYGTDFTNIKELQSNIIKNREDISLDMKDGKITIINISGETLNIDYEGSSDEIKNALSLQNTVLGKDSKLPLAPLTQRQQYNTNFNAMYAKNEFPINIKKGDEIYIKLNGKTHTMVYGSSDGFQLGNKKIPKEDSFITIKDFIDKLEKKANLEVFMENGRIKIKNKSFATAKLGITSSNAKLIADMGLAPQSTLASNASISSYSFGVSTYTNTINVYDKAGKKYNVRSHYIAQASIRTNSREKWYTSFSLYDGQKLISDHNIHGSMEFSNKGAIVSTSSFNPDNGVIKEVDKLKLDFLDNKPISINLKSDGNGKTSTNLKYIDSSIAGNTIDGNRQGIINGVAINDQGNIIISFSNQIQETYGRVGLVDFINKNGLKKSGNNMFEESYIVSKEGIRYPASGGASILWDEDGNTSSNVGQRSIETSNVDLTKGLTQLIVMQRSFSANSKAISTSDEMIQQAINLKS